MSPHLCISLIAIAIVPAIAVNMADVMRTGVRRTIVKSAESGEVVGLHAGKKPDNPIRRVPKEAETDTKTALFIASGIMRGAKKLWPKWEETFIKPSEAAGVRFTIAVSTDLLYQCDPDAPHAYHYPWVHPGEIPDRWTPNNCACTSHTNDTACLPMLTRASEASQENYKREIQEIYGSGKGRRVHVEHLHLGQSHYNTVYSRARPVLEHFKGQAFDYIFVARPDILLVDTNFSTDRQFNLRSMCESHPGLNLISGFFTRPDDFHNRDWDWGYALCGGDKIDEASPVMFGSDGPCSLEPGCVPPQKPKEFIGSKPWTCKARSCKWVENMNKKHIRFGTLDDTLFGYFPPGKRSLSQRDPQSDLELFRYSSLTEEK